MYNRREFGKLIGAAIALPAIAKVSAQSAGGVHLGVQTYSFREMTQTNGNDGVATLLDALKASGATECELWSPQLEPRTGGGGRIPPDSPEAQKAREAARKWRLETPIDHFAALRKQFNGAGVTIFAYNYSFNTRMTDEEINRGFEIAHALGAQVITASTTLDCAKRVVPFAEKHKMNVAMHNHSNLKDPNEFATPESFATARKMSNYFKVNLDIGHFTAANFDAVAYIKEHHAAITNLHLKDRKKNQGDNTPWGEGDAPIREVLQLLKRERWPIRAYVEYEYKGAGSPVDEVKKCFAYAKQALA
jgi:sugar phosphate isomerase/epimerase